MQAWSWVCHGAPLTYNALLAIAPTSQTMCTAPMHPTLTTTFLTRYCALILGGDGATPSHAVAPTTAADNHAHMPLPLCLQGNWVVLASEPRCAVGCDVSAPRSLGRAAQRPLSEWLQSFKGQLTPDEVGCFMFLFVFIFVCVRARVCICLCVFVFVCMCVCICVYSKDRDIMDLHTRTHLLVSTVGDGGCCWT